MEVVASVTPLPYPGDVTSDEVTSTAAGPWGPDVLARLDQDQDWRQIETIWRLGPAEHIERTSVLMANSNDERLGTLLVEEVLLHRYQTATDKIPGLLYENHTPCDPAIADRLRERVLSEDPLPGPHADKKPVLLAWLLSQPGTALDDLAVAIATENHAYATRRLLSNRVVRGVLSWSSRRESSWS